MHGLVKACFVAAALMLVALPLAAEEIEKSAPAEAAQSGDAAPAPHEAGAECSAGGKCCGSAACGEARKLSHQKAKAAMADCPCKRNSKKPDHTP
jgi:hypothetical protein